jgi:hypothetical protein
VLVWDAATGQVLLNLQGHQARITSVAFSPDGSRIVTGADDRTVVIWEAATGDPILTFTEHRDIVRSVAFSPDGQRVVSGGWDRTPIVWDAAHGAVQLRLHGHRNEVVTVAFSPDGSRILTGGLDRQTRLWDAVTGQQLLTLNDCIGQTFSPDGRRLAAALDPTVKIWQIPAASEVVAWRAEERRSLQLLAGLERDRDEARRTQPAGLVHQWLVLLPIGFAGEDGRRALADPQLADEGRLRPRAGDAVRLGATELRWTPIVLQDDRLDFGRLSHTRKEWAVAYAVSSVVCDAGPKRVLLLTRSDDQCRVYLNGDLVVEHLRAAPFTDTERAVTVELRQGINLLVLKVVNERSNWQSSVRFTGLSGEPVSDLTGTLEPPR